MAIWHDVGDVRNFKSLVEECAVILATLLSCDMLNYVTVHFTRNKGGVYYL